jgi:hypothetical protein
MWDETQNWRTADLEVRERLNGSEKSWVIGRLVAQSGINGARWRSQQSQRLSVQYDADVVDGSDLVELLHLCGLHVRRAPLEA